MQGGDTAPHILILASNNDESTVVQRQKPAPGGNPTPVFLPINVLGFVHLQAS
jgi:hypothetical protein